MKLIEKVYGSSHGKCDKNTSQVPKHHHLPIEVQLCSKIINLGLFLKFIFWRKLIDSLQHSNQFLNKLVSNHNLIVVGSIHSWGTKKGKTDLRTFRATFYK
jgi:hypothetical protein